MDRPDLIRALAAMDDDEFDAAVDEARGSTDTDPKLRAAQALRRSRGLDRRTRASKDGAVDALRNYRRTN